MTTSSDNQDEKIIKSKYRVQKHGEVFTPKKVINMMLNQPGIKEACENLTSTFLEPSAGEGAFLVVILKRKLQMVAKTHNTNIKEIENYSLLALSTLYGVELLEDNTHACVMNMFQEYYNFYMEQTAKFGARLNNKVIDSAKKIISANIEQGDFLARRKVDGKPIVFSEWNPIITDTTNIKIERTEYTLDEIYANVQKSAGEIIKKVNINEQISFSENMDNDLYNLETDTKHLRYVPTDIINLYLEEMEE